MCHVNERVKWGAVGTPLERDQSHAVIQRFFPTQAPSNRRIPCSMSTAFSGRAEGPSFHFEARCPTTEQFFSIRNVRAIGKYFDGRTFAFAALFSSSFASRCFFCCCVRACSLLLLFCHSLLFCLLLPPPLVLGIAGLFCHSPALPFCLCFGLLLPPNRFSSARLLLLFPPHAQGSTFHLQRCPPHFHYC